MTIFEMLRDLVYIKDNPNFQKFDAVEKSLYLSKELSAAMLTVYRTLRADSEAEYTTSDLAEALEQFYAEYVAPIDLPINDFLESMVDMQLPSFFKPAIDAISSRLQTYQSPPPRAIKWHSAKT